MAVCDAANATASSQDILLPIWLAMAGLIVVDLSWRLRLAF